MKTWLLAFVLASAAVGCSGTESGNPPSASPPAIQVSYDDEQGLARVVGGTAAASPPGATLQLTNLTSGGEPASGLVAPDGSFEVVIEAIVGDSIRLVVLTSSAHSEVLLVGEVDSDPQPTDCIRSDGGLVVDVPPGGSADLAFTNACSQTAELEVIEVRYGPELRVEPVTIALAVGEAAHLRFNSPEGAFVHAIVVVEVQVGADRTTRYLSVFPD